MLTNAERKAKHRKKQDKLGRKRLDCYINEKTYAKIEAYKEHNNCTYAKAIEGLLL